MSLIEPPGLPVTDRDVRFPPHSSIPGKYTSLQPLSLSHSYSLFSHLGSDANARLWTYMPQQPPADQTSFDAHITALSASRDPQYYTVVVPGSESDETAGTPLGIMSLLSIVPEHRRLEIGWVILGAALQRTRPATEAFYLLLRRAFDELGYQRVEWKANALNAPSLAAAERMGFVSEGTFR